MATSSSNASGFSRVQAACATCVRGGKRFVGRYRAFLLDPGTLFTLASLILLVIAAIVTPDGLINPEHAHTWLYLASALAGSVFIWWEAIQGIREKDFTADIPVSFATIAALIIGQYSAAAVVAVLLLLGGMLEEFVSARAGNALDSLAKLLPDRVTIRREGEDRVVALSEVLLDDLVLIRSGERIPVDGVVAQGTASINQATITGESLAVEKRPGDPVFAGTLNELGALEVRTTKVGEETTLGQIRRMVEEAEAQKAPIERILNRYAKFYTPAALILGALVWWWSGDILRAITILIVFCPCVMVLATPTALVASIGNAALRGSLVKKGATIEAMAKVTAVAFDKTGTLTFGRPKLTTIQPLAEITENDLLRLAAIAEKLSEHPLGRAVVQAALSRELTVPDPEEFTVLPGLGVRARMEGAEVVVGRPQLLSEQDIDVPAEVVARARNLAEGGRTVILVAHNRQVVGMLVLEDTLRPQAGLVITRLRKLGIRTVLVTGDNTVPAERIAGELGISEVHAEVLPAQKVEIVKQLQAQGLNVAFVGDGVNDGPALATANVGVAMGLGGTDVAIETAEIALLSDDLTKLPHLLSLSRQAMRAIKQNLIFSLSVLAIAVGLAIPGILAPVTGALLHELSSIPVIANSARLIGLRERD
ncbi:heavy metal translocating P-type ATPase [Ktedonobacter robiniae]|uniref:Copper-translocating P-type ATPase n=1 Tax=Ktedonobacter robiniae TaxID=2778365 RepID=A0ABQ3V6C7_9CHLR|nr:cation-translocating P-type ATPase [Ktedonobacter robiniae]GHO60786.1 copper-translocating P-type ATPase [Ktedonobacter robiniae]